ncbi:ABC transporter ATP-binding protein [Vineibacter terrae]|uniref:ABC transporter ATP-binding protein n=1 Tax=Vineibacter terrae TaxID=2586908 RepID=UPI001C49B1F5|nr:ABC transporter ATP-binding protein [Vineibacter terrae]
MLDFNGVSISYGAVRAVSELSFAIEPGETVALIGANGAGKSSILKAIMGIAPIRHGSIVFENGKLDGLRTFQVVRRGIGYSPEGRRVFAATSVIENLHAGGHILPRPQVPARLAQVLDYFPRLRERAHQASGSLSGGEQQMLAIGRALMSRPRLLLLDEPTLGLAPVMVQHIGEVIRTVQAAEGFAVLVAEQNAVWALKLAGRGIVLEVGHKKFQGRSQELAQDPVVRAAYLGTD